MRWPSLLHFRSLPALRETTEHAVLECPLYEELREPLDRAMREHTALVLEEHGYAMAPPEALRWG